jgi:hypothetical protein
LKKLSLFGVIFMTRSTLASLSERDLGAHLDLIVRQIDSKLGSVQVESRPAFVVGRVQRIAEDRVAKRGQMHTQLMTASGQGA